MEDNKNMYHIEVWYDQYYKSWVVSYYDKDSNIVDDSYYTKYKNTAIESALAFKPPHIAVEVFDMCGNYQETLY